MKHVMEIPEGRNQSTLVAPVCEQEAGRASLGLKFDHPIKGDPSGRKQVEMLNDSGPLKDRSSLASPPKRRPQPERVEKFLYSKAEAAYALGVSKRSIEYLISAQKLETRRIGSRVLIPADALRRFARANHFESVAS